MQTQMTERDKKLLYILGFVVIIAIFGLGAIRPIYNKISKTNKEISKVKEDYDNMKMKIMRVDTIKTYVDTMDKNVESLSSIYLPMMNSSQIDKYITDKALNNKLLVTSLNIEMPSEFVLLEPYKYSVAQKEKEAKEAAEKEEAGAETDEVSVTENSDSTEAADAVAEEEKTVEELLSSGEMVSLNDAVNEAGDTTNSGVYAANVTLNVEGDEGRERRLLNDFINNNPATRVVSYSWSEPVARYETDANGRIRQISKRTKILNVILHMYMYDDTSHTSPNKANEEDAEGGEEESTDGDTE